MKVKYLAYVTWALYFISFAMGDWAIRGMIAAATLNFFVFFGEQVFRRMAHGKRAMEFGALRSAETDKPFHRCAVCGITDKSNPDAEFRYCSKCAGNPGYCMEHIENHEHLSAE
jgi:hypothetical protein